MLAAFLQLPAFFASCTRQAYTPDKAPVYTTLQWTKTPAPEAVDLFFFETQGSQLLDAYQQVVQLDEETPVYGMSALGSKHLVALSGTAGETARWADIRTLGNLQKHVFSLAEESARTPLLFGQAELDAGASRRCVLDMNPLLTAIRLRSVSCDFLGRPYFGEPFFLTQIFLQIADNAGEAVENLADGNHADFHDAFLQFAGNTSKILCR